MELPDEINNLARNLNAFIEVPFKDDAYRLPIFVYEREQERLKGLLVTQGLTQEGVDALPPAMQELFLRFSGVDGVVFVVDLDFSDADHVEMSCTAVMLEDKQTDDSEPTLLTHYENMLHLLETA